MVYSFLLMAIIMFSWFAPVQRIMGRVIGITGYFIVFERCVFFYSPVGFTGVRWVGRRICITFAKIFLHSFPSTVTARTTLFDIRVYSFQQSKLSLLPQAYPLHPLQIPWKFIVYVLPTWYVTISSFRDSFDAFCNGRMDQWFGVPKWYLNALKN